MLVLSVLLVLLVGVVGTAAVESTSVSLTLDPTSICVGGAIWCTATVTNTASDPQNGTPQGTVSFSSDGAGYFSTTPATLSGGTCAVWYTPTSPNGSPHTITATYNSSDAGKWQDGTSNSANVTVKWCVDVQVMGSETPLVAGDWTWVTATVVETTGTGPTPTGWITFSRVDGNDDGTFFDGTECAPVAGMCRVKYRANSIDTGEIHELKAHFDGDDAYAGSDADGYYDQVVTRRQADVVMTLSTTTAYIYQPVTVTVWVGGDTTAGTGVTPSGSVTFSDEGKNGVFSLDSTTLSAGQCTVTYTPHENDAGVITITATYAGSAVYDGASIAEDLVVELRPTRVTVTGSTNPLYVRQSYDFTVTVEDIAGPGTGTSPAPTGSLVYSSTLPAADVSFNPGSGSSPFPKTFTYTCLGLDTAQGYDVVKATYTPDDGIHAAPEGSENNRAFGQGVSRRATVTSITNVVTSSTGATFTSETVEKSGLGPTPYPLTGTLTLLAPNTAAGAHGPADTLSHDFTVTSDSPFLNVTVQYESTDRVHLASFGSANIDRSSYYAPGVLPDNPTDYDNCTDGCGTGGTNVENAIYALNSTEVALTAAKMALDLAALILDVIPDPVTAAGCIVVGGATIPASDIAAAVVAGAGIAIDIAIAAMDTDLDDDGIPDSIESTITHTDPYDWDSDDDGMGDLDEIDEAGGYYGGTRRPDPKDSDSDDDKLLDGDEANLTHTDFCVADTDCDTVSDGVEASTGKLFSGLPSPSADIRDQADPLVQDTDGDGLRDGLEIAYGCPYVNDDDSDDDGIQDGYEDADHTGTITNTIGTSTTQGSGETSYCVADTDADGLLDGAEEGMFGKSVTPKDVSTTVGVEGANLGATVPALDPDMDNDGLSDYAEVSTYQTDPMDADTDDDTLSDGAEIATYAYIDSRDHSNPREDDTDGDGLTDDKEIAVGCPFVNDDDSDDDGLQDGTESWDGNATCDTKTIGNSTLQSSTSPTGETLFCDPDTDDDGLTDGEEVALLGGLPVSRPTGFTTVVPKGVSIVFGVNGSPLTATVPALDDDSDNDGLSDYEEVSITHTDPLDQDSDNDTLSDANELIATAGSAWPRRSFVQVSDPLDPDSDDDGLPDQIEYNHGLGSELGTSRASGGVPDNECPYVDDDDSDDDGLQDGTEDADRDGVWDSLVPAHSTQQNATGETNLCDPDTDDDGLTDGEEVGLFGGLPVGGTLPHYLQAVSTTAGLTIPALDDDSDNDGLSDYEEVNITRTDPLDADTDNDNITDANELIATSQGTTPVGFPIRTFIQESDPLDPDTDDDYLRDDMEYKGTAFQGTGLGVTRLPGGTPDNICPYVNDDDSDDDGVQDGVEDANKDGTYGLNGGGMLIGGIGSHVGRPDKNGAPYWETNLCDPDTDDDGLLDGEEVGLLGGTPLSGRPGPGETFSTVPYEQRLALTTQLTGSGPGGLGPYSFTPTSGPRTTATVPALDIDSDDDGLSDYEEVNITGTDPLDQDSDNDTLMDADELIATGGVVGAMPRRSFDQESDPLDINTDDDHLFDPQEYAGSGLSGKSGGLSALGDRDTACPYVNDDDSDDDGIQDGKVLTIAPPGVTDGFGKPLRFVHYEDFVDVARADVLDRPGIVRVVPTAGDGEQYDDPVYNVCDADSDGDGLNDGEEAAIGTNPDDWDTDDDGRSDWHETTGGGPIPTDPFDPDTDDDGLLDSAEVFGQNTTNPVNADTDGDGLCDGGAGTPWMTSGDVRVVVNPICKSCSAPGLAPCAAGGVRAGSASGIGDHPNPSGFGEDKDGDGEWDGSIGQMWGGGGPGLPETDPNQYDTDGDADGDGIEVLGFSTSRAYLIPPADLFGRPITVQYPSCGCLQPLVADTDQDGLEDGYEDRNHDGNFDFLPSEFDHQDPLPGPPIPYPTETNPCDPDTDHDELTDFEERNQRQPLAFYPPLPVDNDGDLMVDEDRIDGIDNDGDGLVDEDPPEGPIELTFNPTNPLDHDTDNDRIYDGPEVHWVCVALTYSTLDNDTDGRIDEDPIDGLDNDFDGLFDEDPVDFAIRFVPMLDPTNRDSDSDGFIDGLDDDPCNSELIPLLAPVQGEPVDTDGDGFSDLDEVAAGTHPNGPEDHPAAYCQADLDFDESIDDRIWLEPSVCCGQANSVVIDLDSNVLIDLRLVILPRNVKTGDFDGDGSKDDLRYTLEYGLSNYRVSQPRVLATIDDYNGDLVIDHVLVERK